MHPAYEFEWDVTAGPPPFPGDVLHMAEFTNNSPIKIGVVVEVEVTPTCVIPVCDAGVLKNMILGGTRIRVRAPGI